MTGTVRREMAAQGQALPLELNAENLAARAPGAGEAGLERVRDMVKDVRAITGDGWPDVENHVNTYLRRIHDIDILAEKGAGRKVIGGLKGPPEVQQALDELEVFLGPERFTQVQDAATVVVGHGRQVLDRMVVSGLVDKELADALKLTYPHYTPTRVMREVAEVVQGVSKRKLSVTSSNLKRFTEEGTERAAYRPIDAAMEAIMQGEVLIARNDAAKAIAAIAERQGTGKRVTGVTKVATIVNEAGEDVPVYRRRPGEIPGTMSYMDGGKRVVYEVEPWLEKEAKLLNELSDPNALVQAARFANGIPRALFVTYNPSWPAANFMIDWFTTAVQGVPPTETIKGLIGAIRDIGGNDPVLAEMRRLRAGQAGFFQKTPADLAKEVRRSGGLALESRLDWRRFKKNPLSLLQRLGEGQVNVGRALEMANRRAAYTTALKGGASPEDAALFARRITIDFNRAGTAIRQANDFFLFLNASVQGSLLPYRVLRDNARARWLLGTATASMAGLTAYNLTYPEYQDVPRNIRYGSVVVMVPSNEKDEQGHIRPHYITVIPNTREWATFLGPVTYFTEKLHGAAQQGFEQFALTVLPRVQPISGPADMIPTQIGSTIMELSLNHDFYRNRPIVPPELAGKPAAEQYDAYTSESIRMLANQVGISPLVLQHLVYGTTGGAGKAVSSTLDALVQSLNPKPEDFRLAELAQQYSAIAQTAPQDEVALRKRELLASLPAADQEKILELARVKQQGIPVVSGMINRFFGTRGGELRHIGQEQAAAITGKSAMETENATRALREVIEKQRTVQEQQDLALKITGDGKAWREKHKERAIRYQGALEGLGVLFPSAAQLGERETWTAYQSAVYTLANTIPDRRSKGDVLAAGYRAIPFEEIDPLHPDYKTFRRRREEYKATLSTEDQALLQRTLMASMTPTEREHHKDQETLGPYFEVREKIVEGSSFYSRKMGELETAQRAGDLRLVERMKKQEWYLALNRRVADRHQALRRRRSNGIQAAGEKWDYFGKLQAASSGGSPFGASPFGVPAR